MCKQYFSADAGLKKKKSWTVKFGGFQLFGTNLASGELLNNCTKLLSVTTEC